MSLRVWLSLTKDLRNQGLDDIPSFQLISGNSFITGGKIGEKAFNITKQQRILSNTSCMTGKKQMSYAYWVKVNTVWTTQWLDGIAWYSTDGTSASYSRQEFYNNCTKVGTWFKGSPNSLSGYDFNPEEWTHIAATFNYNTGEAKFYLNGELKGTSNGLSTSDYCRGDFYIGDTGLDILENDVRIYDHALSPLEVKYIAQGLVLHYPLNRGGWGQENLFNWSNNVTGITLNDYQNVGSFTQFTNSLSFDPSTTVGKKYTISFWAKSPNGTTSLLLYNSNSKPKYFNFHTTLTSNLGTEWQFFKYTVTNTQYTGSDANTNTSIWKRIEIYAPNKMKVQVKQIKIEEGEAATPWCPNSSDALATSMGLNNNIEYDTSGYCNNGTRIGTFSWTSNTPKYAVSQVFNGTDNAIQTPSLPSMISDKNYTIAVWIYKTVIGSKSYQTIYGGPNGFEIEARNGGANETKFVPWNWGKPMASYELNEWNHCVFVHSDSDCKIYLNGEYIATGTAKAANPSGNYFVGAWNTATQQNFDGLMSDFRIYATALSAEDVKSLYQNSAYIDNQGNIYGAVYEEV